MTTQPRKPKVEPKVEPTFSTVYYQDMDIPYCEMCGEKFRTSLIEGKPICPIDKAGCDRNVNA